MTRNAKAGAAPVVLLVDDERSTRTLLARRLRTLGYRVITAASYSTALKHFDAGFIDAVIADWDLAADNRKKGDALFSAIRQQDWEVPLILVSGKLHEDDDRAEALAHILKCGAAAFVERGTTFAPIVAALEDLLGRRDVALTQVIQRLRRTTATVRTTAGRTNGRRLLRELLKDPAWKAGTLGRLGKEFAEWEVQRQQQRRS